MRNRTFGSESFSVSEIGLGTWQLGADWGTVSELTAQEVLETAVEYGINFFDTADVYGAGRSESLINKYLKPLSDDIIIATKLGRFPEPGGLDNFSLEIFRRHTEASLNRLGLDCLDLTQLHCIPTELMENGEVFDWLRTLQKEGKIKRFGASVESMDEALICLEQEGIFSLQIIFNVFRQKPIQALFEKAKEKKIALIIRLPLASGLLSGKISNDRIFPENDHRNYNRDGQCFNVGETFSGLPFEKGVELSDDLKSLVPEEMSMAQMALRWILDFDATTVIIPGGKSSQQVIENSLVSDITSLTENLHKKLSLFYKNEVKSYIRGKY
jgi:aryl-alcohol dehydrogenase-like predicted oxidoreductase